MSEADIPGYETGLSEIPDWSNAAGSSEFSNGEADQVGESGWQTVNFPNAIDVNEIDQQDREATEGVFVPIASPDLVYLVQELQQHNQTLQNRVTQLETAIVLGQNALQAEVEKSQQQEALLIQRSQELTAAQSQIEQLFQQLESSQATTQRQQILIETLTAQLESSQERIAQLERDCTLTQQRHHEQVQLLMQAENTCRDLQARLHRQQRHTLQFKAALEKCLEMPSVAQQYANVPATPAEMRSAKRNTKTVAIQIFAPKTQPVQPWSTQGAFSGDGERGEAVELISPIYPATTPKEERHAKREWQILQALGTTSLPDSSHLDAVPMNEPLPTNEVADEAVATHEVETQAVAEIDRLLEKGELNLPDIAFLETLDQQALLENLPLLAPELERQIDRIVQSFMSEPGGNDDALWEDLARLIGFPLEPGEVVQPSSTPAELEPLLEVNALAEDEIEASLPAVESQPVAAVLPEPIETTGEVVHLFRSLRQEYQPNPTVQAVKAETDNPSSRFFTMAAMANEEAPEASEAKDDSSGSQDSFFFQSAGPSPVVYPLRPSKKLKSLAAVQLPSFPRLQSVKG